MSVALTSTTVLGIQLETTPGTAPTTGTYEAIPILDGFEVDPAVKQSSVFQIIDGTRQKSTIVGGASSVRARLNTALSYEVGQQALLRAALHANAWAAGSITADANTQYIFTIVAKYELGATDSFIILRGCEVASATFDMPLNGACTVQYEIIGTAATVATAMPGSATMGTLAGLNPFTTGLTGAALSWNAGSTHAGNASLTVNNGSQPKYAWGGGGADHVINSNMTSNGRFEVYYYDDDIVDAAVNETVAALTFTLKSSDASSNSMLISMPKSKITSAPIADSTGSIVQQAEFFGQYDSGISSQMRITVS